MERTYLKTNYIGLHSARPQSTIISQVIYHPIGSHIIARDPNTLQELHSFKAHNSSVMCLLGLPPSDPQYLVSVSYSGEVKLFTCKGDFMHATSTSQKMVRHSAISNSGCLFATAASFGIYGGIVDVWRIDLVKGFTKVWSFRGNFKFCEFSDQDSLFLLRMSFLEQEGYARQKDLPIAFEKACENFLSESDSEEESLETTGRSFARVASYYACLVKNLTQDKQSRAVPIPHYSKVNTIKTNRQGQVVFAYYSRTLVVMNMESLEVLHTLYLPGAGCIMCLEFLEESIYFSPNQYIFCRFNVNQESVDGEIDFSDPHKSIEVVNTKLDWINKTCSYYGWIFKDRCLLGMNEYGMFTANFNGFPGEVVSEKSSEIYKMTCCGLAVHPSGNYIAVGDFMGNLIIWDSKYLRVVSNATVEESIRCISWDCRGEDLLIGTMSGGLFAFKDCLCEKSQVSFVVSLNDSIICMSFNYYQEREVLALGTTKGQLWVFSKHKDTFVQEKVFLAHKTSQEQDLAFGSLILYSEIWSLSWSPSDPKLVATGSEDQTVKVWNWELASDLVTLPKHQKAVTGVRWEKVSPVSISDKCLTEVFLTCSDDQTVRLFSPQDWTWLHTFHTNVIKEWHTITYACIEKGGERVACVTQNGYLFVWHLKKLESEFIGRIHNGSIEGLDWKSGLLATCSSECIVCVADMH